MERSSSRATRGVPVVERRYAPCPDACASALKALLDRPGICDRELPNAVLTPEDLERIEDEHGAAR